MRKILAVLISAIMCTTFFVFVGCDKGGAGSLEGVKAEYAIKVNDSTYNFLDGVKFSGEGAVSVDTSKVDFTKAGEYTITFKAGKLEKSAKVKIYGMPVVTYKGQAVVGNKINYSFGDATLDPSFEMAIDVKDSMGASIAYSVVEGDVFDGTYGDYEVTYKATDVAGNEATPKITFTISSTGAPIINDTSVDIFGGKGRIAVNLNGQTSMELYKGDDKVETSNYSYNQGELVLMGNYISQFTIGSVNTFKVVTLGGYTEFDLTITNNYPELSIVKAPDYGVAKLSIVTGTEAIGAAGQELVKYEYVVASAGDNPFLEFEGVQGTENELTSDKVLSFEFYAEKDEENEAQLFFYDHYDKNVSTYLDIETEEDPTVSGLEYERWYKITINMAEYNAKSVTGLVPGRVVMNPDSNRSMIAYIRNVKVEMAVPTSMLDFMQPFTAPEVSKVTYSQATDADKEALKLEDITGIYKYVVGSGALSEPNAGLRFKTLEMDGQDYSDSATMTFEVFLAETSKGEPLDIYTCKEGGSPDKITSRDDLTTDTDTPATTKQIAVGKWYRFTVSMDGWEVGESYFTTTHSATIFLRNLEFQSAAVA